MGGFLQAVLFGYTGFRSFLNPLITFSAQKVQIITAQSSYLVVNDRYFLRFFRVQKGCLAFCPLLPDDICELCVRGVNYLGIQMDWLLRKEEVCIIAREKGGCAQSTKSHKLEVVLKASGVKIPLTPGISLVAVIHSDVCLTNHVLSISKDSKHSDFITVNLSFN